MMPTAAEFLEMNKDSPEKIFKLGKVVGVTNGSPSIQFDGEETASGKLYARLSSYTPAVNDRVLLAKISGTYIVLGKVVR
ncbi:hypothetical protein CSTERTH_01110 [Thermoclostridium stercorarium subsp. thermolacticum DSM 2910]|uniref:Uncharacterized protein n=1 Tax=Thermoclostridium stercorarium subsp. thermolacticum DSM 2910 TaxID=1121336 RepID=A0A1B1YAC9_THEST|nr:hypothetical protein [Thermoclostridium stercorarium]ANW97727.1 hypothetical protein CSTERTH_01110 [Thermoclostridium stercorarium subsp. thermolacticum DSM 2910]